MSMKRNSLLAMLWCACSPVWGQGQVARTPAKHPDLSGIWQSLNEANWDLEGHNARPSPVVAMGALGAAPGGLGVVEGGAIPYLPAALAQRKENFEKRMELDPEVK